MALSRARSMRDQRENQSTTSLTSLGGSKMHPLLGKDTKQLKRPALGEIRNRKKIERFEELKDESRSDPLNMTSVLHSLPAPGVNDIDKDDWENPQLCAEYVNDIYVYMRQLETKFAVPHDYMTKQKDINEKMRAILIDWLVQVHLRFHLLPETLYMTVSVLDRYLAKEQVARGRLQLAGVTAMFIASKYEEIYAPELRDFVYITDNAYTGKQIRDTERHMLSVLNHDLGKPLPLHFLRRSSKAGEVDADIHTVAKYLMELSLQDYAMLAFKPSEIAAAALWISLRVNESAITWNPTLVHYSTYTEKTLSPCINRLAKLVKDNAASKLQAVRNKYATSKFLSVSSKPGLQPLNILTVIQ